MGTSTRRAGTGDYDPYWALLWQSWMTVLERARIVSLTDESELTNG